MRDFIDHFQLISDKVEELIQEEFRIFRRPKHYLYRPYPTAADFGPQELIRFAPITDEKIDETSGTILSEFLFEINYYRMTRENEESLTTVGERLKDLLLNNRSTAYWHYINTFTIDYDPDYLPGKLDQGELDDNGNPLSGLQKMVITMSVLTQVVL